MRPLVLMLIVALFVLPSGAQAVAPDPGPGSVVTSALQDDEGPTADADPHAMAADSAQDGHAVARILLATGDRLVARTPTSESLEQYGAVGAAQGFLAEIVRLFTDLAALATGEAGGPQPTTTQAAVAEAATEETTIAVLGTAAAVGLLTLLGAWARKMGWLAGLPLFSRIEGSDLLKHPLRADIIAYVRANPGANTSEVARELDVAWGTITHHLDKLHTAELLAMRRVNNQKCYFEPGAVDRRAMAVRSALKRETAARLALYIEANPGTSQKQIAEDLDLSRAVTSFHVRKLVDHGVLDREKVGKEVRLCLVPLAAEELRLIETAPAPPQTVPVGVASA